MYLSSVRVIAALVCLGGTCCLLGCEETKRSPSPQASARYRHMLAQRAFEQGNFKESLEVCNALLLEKPDYVPALMTAGESATKLGKFDEAIAHYRHVPDHDAANGATARWAEGEIQLHLGRSSDSISAFLASLALDPQHFASHERLAWLMETTGRRREMIFHLMAMMRDGQSSLEMLLSLGNPSHEYYNWEELKRFRAAAPGDLLPDLIQARKQISVGELESAETLLLALIQQQPGLTAAHAVLGSVWLVKSPEKLKKWNAVLPESATADADVWAVRGAWLAQVGDTPGAIRCFGEAVRLDPNALVSHTALAKLLAQVGESELAEKFALKARRLQELTQAIDRIWRTRNYPPTIEQAATLTHELGRMWESIGWCQYGKQLTREATWPDELLKRIRNEYPLSKQMPQTLEAFNLATSTSWLDRFPLPTFRSVNPPVNELAGEATDRSRHTTGLRFESPSNNAGLDFVFHNATVDRNAGRRMMEVTGGGIGVIDYDMDGNSDLFFAQGTAWPVPEPGIVPCDSIYRNLGRVSNELQQFVNVREQARIVERQFGQGVSVADVNGDGFDDIYVANVGENQLWFNQGDGTFVDANGCFPRGSTNSDLWTVSALVADINGDSLPEILDVNYATGDNVYSLRCNIADKPRACPPLVFVPAPQQLWLPTTDGRFEAFQWNGEEPIACYGLGVLAYRTPSSGQPRVFVAVDQQANALLDIQVDPGLPQKLNIEEMALFVGIAFDYAGQAQACMGVASGDVDQNGELDIFVTNFQDESNTLYLQQDGAFRDGTLRTGLVAPSKTMLGFGTQFLDSQLTGQLDLVVLNGHIDDLSHVGVAEKMRPQIFRAMGPAQFEEVAPQEAGLFFETPALGRALALIDSNNDGMTDLVCGDLEGPATLLENRSQRQGNYLTLHLVGVKSDRNAFFTEVTIRGDQFTRKQQLTAGSGYQVSNERSLHFAIPISEDNVTVEVAWPSGVVDKYEGVVPGKAYTLVEGQAIWPH